MVARTASGSVSAAGRRAAKAKGHTMPGTNGKFPINNLEDLRNAKHDIGRTNEPHGKVVAYINSAARRLGGSPVGGSPGGFVPNPMESGYRPGKAGEFTKPHMHALTMAAATHLVRAGHLSPMQGNAIHAKARASMNQLTGAAPSPSVSAPPAFGSLAPTGGYGGGESNGYV